MDTSLIAGTGTGAAQGNALETALWPVLQPFKANRAAVWLSTFAPPLPLQPLFTGTSAFDTPADCKYYDKVSGVLFVPGPNSPVQTVVVNGKTLARQTVNAAGLRAASDANTQGAETNMVPRILPGTGWSAFGIFQCPPLAGGTMYGTVFPAITDGMGLICGSSLTVPNNLCIGLDANGHFAIWNRFTGNPMFVSAGTYFDRSCNTFEAVYNPVTNTISVWLNGVAATSGTPVSATVDIAADDGTSSDVCFGALAVSASALTKAFYGFWSDLAFIPNTALLDSGVRGSVETLMQSRKWA